MHIPHAKYVRFIKTLGSWHRRWIGSFVEPAQSLGECPLFRCTVLGQIYFVCGMKTARISGPYRQHIGCRASRLPCLVDDAAQGCGVAAAMLLETLFDGRELSRRIADVVDHGPALQGIAAAFRAVPGHAAAHGVVEGVALQVAAVARLQLKIANSSRRNKLRGRPPRCARPPSDCDRPGRYGILRQQLGESAADVVAGFADEIHVIPAWRGRAHGCRAFGGRMRSRDCIHNTRSSNHWSLVTPFGARLKP